MICMSRSPVLVFKVIAFKIRDRSELMKYTCKELDIVMEFSQFTQVFSIL